MSSRAKRRPVRAVSRVSRRIASLTAAVEALEVRRLLSHNLTIGTAPTANVSFSGGIYTATNDGATVNINDLQSALVNGDVSINAGTDGTQMGVITWMPGAAFNYNGPAGRTLSIQSGGNNTGGFHLLANVAGNNPLNLNLSSPSDVELFGQVNDSGANIAITANSFYFSNSSNVLNVGGGGVTIAPVTPGAFIFIGTPVFVPAVSFNLDSGTLNDITAGSIQIGNSAAGPVTINAPIQQSSDANITIVSGRGIQIPSGGSWTTNQGTLSFQANQQATPSSGTFNGISITGGSLSSSGGAIVLQGRGGDTGDGNAGVFIDGAGSQITSSGDIQLTGTAGGSGLSDGVDVTNGANVATTSGGNITITGTGASGAGSAGVVIGKNSSPQSIVSAADGTLTINGTASGSAGNQGIFLAGGAQLQATGASTRIALTGVGATPDSAGIFFDHGAALSSNHASVSLIGDTIDLGDFHSIGSSGGNSISLQPASLSRNVQLGGFLDVAGALTFTAKDNAALVMNAGAQVGFSSISIGRSDGTGGLTTASNQNFTIPLTLAAGIGGVTITNTVNPTSLTINTAGSINVGAGGVVQASTSTFNSGGSISNAGGGSITSPTLILTAGTGIGSAASPLVTTVSTALIGRTTSGGIFITNSGSNNLHMQSFGGQFTGLTAGSGDIQLINNGTIGLDTAPQSIKGNGNVTVQAVGTAADIRTAVGTSITTTSGTVTVQAGRDLTIGSNGSAFINNSLGSTNASAVLRAGRDVIVTNLAAVNAIGNGTLSFIAGRNITITHSNSSNGAHITSQSGAIQFTTGAGGTFLLDADNFSSNTISTTGGDVIINADIAQLTSNDRINAGTGHVTIQPATAGRKIDLGSMTDVAPGTLEISSAELSQIVAASAIRIGGATSGDINVTALIGLNGPSTLSLNTGGAINETPIGSLAVPQLAITAVGPVALTSVNAVQSLASNTTGPLKINNDGNALTIGVADGITGVTTANASVEIDSDAATTTAQPINAGTSIVIFSPATSGLSVVVGPASSGSLNVTDAELNNITAGLVQIGNTTTTGNLTVTAPVTAHAGFSVLSLQSGGQIIELGTITVASLSTISNLNAFLFEQNLIGTYAGQTLTTGQPITLENAQSLTIGAVAPLTATTTQGGSVNITVNGNLTIASDINAGTGAVNFTLNGGDVLQAAGTNISGLSITQSAGSVQSNYAGNLHSSGTAGITLNAAKLSISGNVTVDAGKLNLNISGASTLSGVVSGAGGLQDSGAGTLVVTGANSYTGPTNIIQGTVNLTGSLASPAAVIVAGATGMGARPGNLSGSGTISGPITVNTVGNVSGTITYKSNFTVNGGTASGKPIIQGALNLLSGIFTGDGSIAGLSSLSGGNFAPSNTAGSLITGDMTFTPAARFTAALAGIVPGFQYTHIDSTGNINLGGANLVLSGPVSTDTDRYTLILTTGTITGQFAQGGVVSSSFGGKNYQIVYTPHAVYVEVSADLSMSISGPSVVDKNSDAIYTVTLTNNGPSDATNVAWTESFPAGESFVSATNNAFQKTNSASQISFLLPVLQSGASQTYTITAHVDGGVAPGSTLISTVSATSDTRDEFPANNTASSSAVVPAADLSITVDNPPLSIEGAPLTFSVNVSNAGPFDAQGVVITIPTTPFATFAAVAQTSGPAGSFNAPQVGASGTVSIQIPTLASGASAAFTVTLVPTKAGPLPFVASISSTVTGDPNTDNNTWSSNANIVDAPISATGIGGLPFVVEGQF